MLPAAITHALTSPNPAASVLAAALAHYGCQAGTVHLLREGMLRLAAALAHYGCQAGTVHLLREGMLRLAAEINIPDQLLPLIDTVPIGKGIAGLAAERREPVSLCNLQTDTSGQARPAAKQTGMEGTVAVPILVDGDLRGVFGIGKTAAYDWSDAEKADLMEIAAELGRRIS